MTTNSYTPKLFDLDDDVRGLARRHDAETSIAAAKTAKGNAETNRELALRVLREHAVGLSDFELSDLTHVAQTSIGCRRHELVKQGLVEYAGFTRPSPSGAQARVWRIVQ